MSIAEPFTDIAPSARALFASPEVRRRTIGYGIAVALHAAALVALILLPPVILREGERAGQALDVRFYTVAGGPDAQTDAPLFEPPLAGGQTGSGVDGGDGETASSTQSDSPAETPVEDPIDVPDREPETSPEPVEALVPEVDALPDPSEIAPDSVSEAPDASIVQPPLPEQAAPTRVQPPPSQPLRAEMPDLNAPIATAQPGPPVPVEARPAAPVTFADIVARAESRLDPDDFRILANFAGGVTGTIRENFCLSSADANQEAFDCPEGAQLAAPRLAQFGLMGLGEEPPEFLEDMDRLAFQLSQTGAGDGAIGRILTGLREARRDAINTPDITRQMERDALGQSDNLGVSNPYGDDGP